jgi:putative thiamine transport system ATP-binding protein
VSLTLDHLSVTLHGKPMVALNLTVHPGAPLTLMAPSGSGKSTTLAAIIGTLAPEFTRSGHVILNGKDVTHLPTHQRQIGLMFQDAILFPHLSVGQNLGFALPPGPNRRARIEAALAEIDLQGFSARDPATLSGGQAARVALARSLLAQPQALLLDEPFAKLDAALRHQIRDLVFAGTKALPVILVTHDPEDARAAGGPVLTPLGVFVET